MTLNIKIRGIYATALTKLFLDRGMRVAFPSVEIAQRFQGHPRLRSQGPIDVDIEDLEDRQGISMSGEEGALKEAADLLRDALPDGIFRPSFAHEVYQMRVEFPYGSKGVLDEIRNAVLPTLLKHHRLRIIAPELVDLLEKKDLIGHPERRTTASRNLERKIIWDALQKGKKIGIEHVKLDGRTISLSEGEILETDLQEGSLALRRSGFRCKNTYDGVNAPKKPGDFALTRVKEGDLFYSHHYFRSDGKPIGTYHNINTPVELYPDRIRYVDLEIDVVQWPDGRVRVIDQEELKTYLQMGVVCEKLCKTAVQIARDLASGSLKA